MNKPSYVSFINTPFSCPVLATSSALKTKNNRSCLLSAMSSLQEPGTVCKCWQASVNSSFPFPNSSRCTSQYAEEGLCFSLMATNKKVRAHACWLSRGVCSSCKTFQIVWVVRTWGKLSEVSVFHWSTLLLGGRVEADVVPFGQGGSFHLCSTSQCSGRRKLAFIWVMQCTISCISGS